MNLPVNLGVIYCANLNRLKLMSDLQTLYIWKCVDVHIHTAKRQLGFLTFVLTNGK